MEIFRKIMSFFRDSETQVDPVATLPVEVMNIIFRSLDSQSLLNAAQVSQGWLHVCRGDSSLRATARRHLRREMRQAYDLPNVVKTHVLKTTVNRKKLVMRIPQNTFAARPAAVLNFGHSGVSSEYSRMPAYGQTSKSSHSSDSKRRLTIRFR